MESSIASVILSLTIFLVISATAASEGLVQDSPVTCSSEGVECEFDESNLIDAVMHVMSLEECRQLCLDQESCGFITYFDDSAAPFSHFCQLLTSCDTVNNCTSCVSENMVCYRSCSDNVVGDLDENVLDVVPNIDTQAECKQSCLSTPRCSFYTWYIYHRHCFLQSEFVGPAQPCTACITGPVDCSDTTPTTTPLTTTATAPPTTSTTAGCSLTVDGKEQPAGGDGDQPGPGETGDSHRLGGVCPHPAGGGGRGTQWL